MYYMEKLTHKNTQQPTTERVIDPDTRRKEFLDRKHNLSRGKRMARRLLPLVVAVGGIAFVGNQTVNHINESNTISNAYYGDVEPGSNVQLTIREIADEHAIDMSAVYAGQEAIQRQTSEQKHPYMAQPGDTVIVYTNNDNDYLSSEILTVQEQKENK